jgi:hypothetical protein
MGRVRLNSTVWDNIPVVEIRQGTAQDIDEMPGATYNHVKKGASFLSDDGVKQCFRRSSNPADKNSPLNVWKCNSNPLDDDSIDDWELD